jgi:hypothetical protein
MLLVVTSTDTQITTSASYITRLNYGFAAVKLRPISVVEDYYRYTLRLTLPQRPRRTNGTSPYTCEAASLCNRMRVLEFATGNLSVSMRETITTMINGLYDLIPDIDARSAWSSTQGRSTRGLIDAAGQLQSWLFGVATEAELDQFKDEISKLKELTEASAAASDRVRLGLVTLTKLENSRMNKLHSVLQEQQKTMGEVYAQIRALGDSNYMEYSALTYITQEIAKYIELHQNVQQVESGVEALLQGQLSPKLLSVELVTQILQNVTRELEQSAYYLCYQTPQDLYESRNFDYARHANDIIIRLRLPYSKYRPLNLYRTITIPMKVNGRQGFVTQLQDVPKYFVSSLAQNLVGEISEIPSLPVVEMYEVKWHTENTQSCLYHLMRDETELTALFCQFSARKQIIEPTYIRLKKGIFILQNYTDVKVICPEGSTYNLTNTKCHPCLARLQCGCELEAEGQTLVAASSRCLRHEKLGPKLLHGINLILLQSFYDLSNWTLSTKNLLEPRDYREPMDLHWKIYSENVTKLIASDQEASYSLKKLAENFQNDTFALNSPSEALLFDFLHEYSPRQRFWYLNFNSWTTYALLILYLLAAVFIVIQYRSYQRLRILQAVAAQSIQLLPRVRGFELKQATSTQLPQLVSYFESLKQNIGQIRNLDFLLLAIGISTIIVGIIVLIIIIRKLKRRSSLYADFASEDQIVQIKLLDFPNATRAFSVVSSQQRIQFHLRNLLCCGILAITDNPWRVINTITKKSIRMPKFVFISLGKMASLRKLFRQSYEITPLVVHTREHLSPLSNSNEEEKLTQEM